MQPVKSVADLNNIPRENRYVGMSVVVLNSVYVHDDEEDADVLVSQNPQEHWLIGGTANKNWHPKPYVTNDEFDTLVLSSNSLYRLYLQTRKELNEIKQLIKR
jgi:hypothetical protein